MTLNRRRVVAVLASCLAASRVLLASPCPSDDIDDVLNDPAVQQAMHDAWRDSDEGQPDEHEEGGWIEHCRSSNGDGSFRYYTQIRRWAPGDVDGIEPSVPRQDDTCTLVADFHTHPGGGPTENGGDTYENWHESGPDLLQSANNGLPGIIVWGTGDNSRTYQYGYNGMTEPRDPSWGCDDGRVPARPGSGWGEPHLRTFDDYTYDFQAVGDFELVQAAQGNFEIQARHQPYHDSKSVAVTTGLVVRDGNDRVEWRGGVFDPIVNGQSRPMSATDQVRLRSWSALRRTNDGFVFLSSAGDRLTVNVGNEALDYVVRPALQRRGRVKGLFGNFDDDPDNDLEAATGRVLTLMPDDVLDRAHPLYAIFGESWRVAREKSLFAAPFSSSADAAQFPQKAAPPADADTAAAAAKCAAQHLADDAVRHACEFDVAVTHDDAFLATAGRTDRASPAPAPTAEGAIQTNREVQGALARADARAVYSIDLARGTYVFDGRGSRDAAWTIAGPDGTNLLDADQSAYMGHYPAKATITRAGRHTITVTVRQQMTDARFRFRVRAVPVIPAVTLAPGEVAAGRVASVGEEHAYRIALRAGTYDLQAQTAEDTAWNLTAADGRSLLDANQQEFMEGVLGLSVPAAGTYTLTIRGRGVLGLGAYRVSVVAR